jgi:release factor glutamine methyltransferase
MYEDAEVTAIDRSADALALAAENTDLLCLTGRITFLEGNWFAPLDENARFDLIVSNPPYLTEEEMGSAEPEVVGHEPHDALVSGGDGLDDLRVILGQAKAFLAEGGLLAMETGIAQHKQLQGLAEANGLSGESIEDLSERPRFFFAQPKS